MASKTIRFTLKRMHVNNQGYDSTGAYWGDGAPLYWACADQSVDGSGYYHDSFPAWYFRAANRKAAKQEVLKQYPNAVFYN